MKRGLVLVEDTDAHEELLGEAKSSALGSDAELVLLVTLTESEYEETQEVLDTVGTMEHTRYPDDDAFNGAINEGQRVAQSVFGDGSVSYDVVARISDDGERADAVLDVAEEVDADHVFLLGRNRSPTGKALFGDLAQRVVLNFDGYVTLRTD